MSQFYRYTDGNWQYPVKQNQALNPANSFVAAGTMAGGFPAPLAVVIPSNGIITNAPNQNYFVLPKNVPVPYVESWNVAIQRALPANFSIEAAFVGNHGVHQRTGNDININASQVPGSGAAGQPLNKLFGRTATTTVPDWQSTFYDSFQLKVNRRFSNGLSIVNSYAFGKSIDYSAGSSGLNHRNLILNKGLADLDRRHIFTSSYTYELPFGKGKRWASSGPGKWLLGGWQLNSFWTWESGLPIDIVAPATSLNAPGLNNRPNVKGPVNIIGNAGLGQFWFDKSAFSLPPANTIGNVGRNVLHGPHLFNIDGSVFRKFNITERLKMEFRAESFNASNTPWFDKPNTNIGDAAFGQVTTAQGTQSVKVNMNRSFQASLRIAF